MTIAATTKHEKVSKPRIEYDRSYSYVLPQGLYARKLINSPVEFGTVLVAQSAPDGEYPEHLDDAPELMKRGWTYYYEVDIAMHPIYGAAICGYVGADDDASFREELLEQRQILRESREALKRALEDEADFDVDDLRIGLFIAAPKVDETMIPTYWSSREHAWICHGGQADSFCEHLMEAMKEASAEAERPFADYGPRFMATIQNLGDRPGGYYTSCLKWLMDLDVI